ncbi:MAG: UV DNA damage repair endonuclease UvsE [Candidatus Micrarchaeota archaeon]|nr:UV DNA damage repair endonuclease UvsE [Candidatus Micrarchaeota archaeon]
MNIGYPCVNYTIKRSTNNTFRLSSYSHNKVRETIQKNIDHFWDILRFNLDNDIYFFRLGSQFIPFASHDVFDFNWQHEFRDQLSELGRFIREQKIFITMHPGQYVVLNSPNEDVVRRSIKELDWHAELLDIMNIDGWIQIHIGGIFGDKQSAIQRFIENYRRLPARVRRRLALENDDRLYNFSDVKQISERLNTKIIFDIYHHKLNPSEHSLEEILSYLKSPVIDYSSGDKYGRHHDTIHLDDFLEFYTVSEPYQPKIMFEIKDKEKSVLKAINHIKSKKL